MRERYKKVYAEQYLNEGITKETILSQQSKIDKAINDVRKMVQSYEKANSIKKGMVLDYVDDMDKFIGVQFDDIDTTISGLSEGREPLKKKLTDPKIAWVFFNKKGKAFIKDSETFEGMLFKMKKEYKTKNAFNDEIIRLGGIMEEIESLTEDMKDSVKDFI